MLQIKTFERLLKFATLGLLGFAVNVGITALTHEVLGAPPEVAFAVALLIVLGLNFISSRYLIFEAATGSAKHQLFRYVLASAGFRVSEYLGFLVIHTLAGVPYLPAALVVLGISFFIKFFFYDRVVFPCHQETE
jgi:putative flippase GtrA